jgi:putative inorganic carbon (HCO3(-)) transporter
MDQELAAQLAALVGALGSVLVLLARRRSLFLGGVVLLGAAGVGLAGSLVGESVVDRATSPVPIAAAAFGVLLLVAAAIPLLRYPGAIIPLVAAAAPFRPPIDFGGENRFLVAIATDGQIGRLLPLYAVLAAATLAIAIRVLRSGEVAPLPPELAYPAAFFVGLAGLSLLWSSDVHEGADTILFFLYPSVLMVAVVARSPVRAWLPRALFIITVALATLFALVGFWEVYAEELIFSTPRVEIGNVYADFFRVTSLFNDPSLYGRHVVVGIVVVLVAMWAGRIHYALAAGLVGLLWAGLFFSYSQSSMVALIATAVAIVLLMGDRLARRIVVVAAVLIVLLGGVAVAASVEDESAGRITSDRSRRANLTAEVFLDHPLVGVGIGGHASATAEIAPGDRPEEDYVSHTTPLTIAAELGLIGILAYLALMGGSVLLLDRVRRVNEALGVGLAAVFVSLFVHALFYGGFFEDPVAWLVLGVGAAVVVSARPLNEPPPAT